MQTITVPSAHPKGIAAARDFAVAKSHEYLAEPVVLSWRNDETETIAPEIPGAVTPERWKEYGVANGGKVEVDIGEDFHFILGEAAQFVEPHSLFTNVTDADGNTYLCVTGACTSEDADASARDSAASGARAGDRCTRGCDGTLPSARASPCVHRNFLRSHLTGSHFRRGAVWLAIGLIFATTAASLAYETKEG
jgi:hypothetical protein